MNASDKSLVESLSRSKIFRDYENAFRSAVGLPFALTAAESWGLPFQEDKNENPFCHVMAKTNKTCAACLQVQANLAEQAREEASTATCAFGLCDSAVPVKLGNRLVGFLRTGQVMTHEASEADFAKVAATLEQWGANVKPSELRDAFFGTKVVPPEQYQAILRLLKVFADHLGTVSNQILVAEDAPENPQIARAKDFITENMAENISLADCARTAHMSTFYFCKMFKRATGLSFTEYLSRLRTEKAKARLLDPNVRVSEVAFEVGFQSLSQFNRVFKKVTGQSPSEYRQSVMSSASVKERSHHSSTAAAHEAAPRFRFGVVQQQHAPRSDNASSMRASVAAR